MLSNVKFDRVATNLDGNLVAYFKYKHFGCFDGRGDLKDGFAINEDDLIYRISNLLSDGIDVTEEYKAIAAFKQHKDEL